MGSGRVGRTLVWIEYNCIRSTCFDIANTLASQRRISNDAFDKSCKPTDSEALLMACAEARKQSPGLP